MRQNRTQLRSNNGRVIDAIPRYFPDDAPIMLNGKSYKPSAVAAAFQAANDAIAQTEAAYAAWQRLALHERGILGDLKVLSRAFELHLQNKLGMTSPRLLDFRYKPARKAKKTAEVKRAAAEKALATRKARGTLGPKQKKKIKGKLPGSP
jgi:hypothetical protein